MSGAEAQTGSWNVNNAGNWSAVTNWLGGTVPNGVDHIADITFQITSDRVLTIDSGVPGSNVTLGGLRIGDASGGQIYTISGGTITFQSTTGNAFLTKQNKGGNDTISSAIQLNSALDVLVADTNTNSQGLTLSGKISGGTAGIPTINYSATGASTSVRHLLLNNLNNDFAGQIVVSSGLLRLEGGARGTSNTIGARAAGLRGSGNETIILNGGSVDLRDSDYDIQSDDTEMFRIEGAGSNGLGALVNTAGSATLSHLTLTGDATVGGYSNTELKRYLNAAGTAETAPVLDFGGNALTKLGTAILVVENADLQNTAGAVWNINEGSVLFRNKSGLVGGGLIGGTTYGNQIDGMTFNVAYYQGTYDGIDPTNGSRTSDPFNPNRTGDVTAGNAIIAARLMFRTDWGTGNTFAANTKVVETYDNLTINLNYGALTREGNTEAGRTFDHIFGPGTTVNLVGGGMEHNIFSFAGGSGSYNSAIDAYDHPGVTEITGQIDNTSGDNAGTGFTKRGDRELRLTGNNTNFNGDVLVKQTTGRFLPFQYSNTSPTGAAESQYFSMSLAGAAGSLSNANSITLTRWGSLALLNNSANAAYSSANNNNRLNDGGTLSLRNGFLTLETDATVKNTENFGNVVADIGTNYLYLDTRAGGQFDGSFASFTRNNGGVLKIYDLNSSHTWGTGDSDDRLKLNDTTGLALIGTNTPGSNTQQVIPGLFGGTLPTSFAARTGGAANRTDYTMQNAYAMGGAGIGLMTLDNGYLRPLTASEYSIGGSPVAGSNWLLDRYITPGNALDRANYANRNVTGDITVNSLTIGFNAASSGQAIPTAGRDYLIIEPGRTLTINSGIINFASFAEATTANMEAVIRGGSISMNGQAAIINSALGWHDTDANSGTWTTFNPGNNALMRSNIINATDLVKTGRNNLYLDTWNQLSGNIYISEQGSLIARHPGALGAGAPGREVVIGGAGNFILEYGTNIKGIDLRATNSFDTNRTILRAEGATHSTWGGNVIMDLADASGSNEYQQHVITARNNGTLSLYGNIYTGNNQNYTDNDSWADPTVISTAIGESATINLRGQFRDIETGALSAVRSVGDAEDGSFLDRNHSLVFQMRGHDEINVNAFQQWNSTGAVYATQGYFRIQYDPLAATDGSGFQTDSARAGILNSNQWNQFWIGSAANYLGIANSATNAYHGHVMMTEAGQILNYGTEILVRNSNRDYTLTFGGENESGSSYIGSAMGEYNYRILFQNENSDRDLRFLQTRGGTLTVNARLEDGGTSVNSGITASGPGTIRFNANALGGSTVERWNFMGGETIWAANPTTGSMLGDNRYAASGATTLFGGGNLTILGETATNRAFSMTGAVRVTNGSSVVRVNSPTSRTMTLNLGAAAAVFEKGTGGTMSFIEEGPGTSNITLQATGLTNTGLMPWATYGTSATAVEHFANNGASGALTAYAGYVTGTTEANFLAANNVNVSADIGFTANATSNTLRFAGASNLDLGSNTLTLASGAILVPTSNTGSSSITGGKLTSGYDGNLGAAGTVRDLMIHNWSPSGSLTIGSEITNNGSDKVNVVVGGTGTTVLAGDNSFTGELFLNGGVVEISSEDNLGNINGGVARLERVSNGGTNGASLTGTAFTVFGGGGGSGLNVTFNTDSGQAVSATNLVNGGSGYTSGLFLSTTAAAGTGTAGIWAIMDTGNLRFNGGTLRVTNDINLNGARTIFLGAGGGTLEVTPGKTLTINGYIASERSHVTPANGYAGSANHLGGNDTRVSDRNPDIGDLTIRGGGTVVITGAPDGTVRANMLNSYGGTTWIDEGTLRLASAGTSAGNGSLGTNRSWIDGTVIGANGTMELATTSDATILEWMTLRGSGYEGGGTIRTQGTARVYRLAGQVSIEEDAVMHIMNGSDLRINESGGDFFGSGDLIRKGNGNFRMYGNNPEWTGKLNLASGTNYLASVASLQGMTGLILDRNAILIHSSGSTSVDEFRDRLPDNLPITADSYTRLRLDSTGGVHSGIEKVGTVTVNSGVFGIEYNIGADIIGSANRFQGDYGGWHFTEIVRNPGASVHLRNFDSGTDFAGSEFSLGQVNDRAVLLVDIAPETIGSGNGLNGNAPIVPGFFGGTRGLLAASSDGTTQRFDEAHTAFRLVTVDTDGNGKNYLRPLKDSEYKSVANPDGATTTSVSLNAQGLAADQNLRIIGRDSDSLTSGQFGSTRQDSLLTLTGAQTVNSLSFNTDVYVNNNAANPTSATTQGGEHTTLHLAEDARLTIASGVIQSSNFGVLNRGGITNNGNSNLDIRSQINGGQIDFAGKEAQIYVGGFFTRYNTEAQINGYEGIDTDNTTLTIASSIVNTNGLVKTGPGALMLTGVNDYTGDTYINQGSLYLRSDFALGRSENVRVTGAGALIVGHSANISGADLHVGSINGTNLALVFEQGSTWNGNIILDNVDSAGATGYTRTFIPRIYTNTTNIGTIGGNIYGGSTALASGVQATESRIFTTYTGAGGILDIRGQIRDTAAGALGAPVTSANQNQVLRMEVIATTNEANVQLWQQYDSAGQIILKRGYLRYSGEGNFYSNAAAAAQNPNNPMSGFHMGGRGLIASGTGDGQTTSNLAFVLANEGSVFNLSSWTVGGDTTDPNNIFGAGNWGLGNTTGNSMIGGENRSGEVVFGTGGGTIRFTPYTTVADRDLRLYAAPGGEVSIRANFVDGGTAANPVNTSITKIGAGQVNLQGSSAGASTVEGVNVLGGLLMLEGYDVNPGRRIGMNAKVIMGGGALMVDDGQEDFGALTINAGGSVLGSIGSGQISIASLGTRSVGGSLHFQSIDGGSIRVGGVAAGARIGSYATFGSSTGSAATATDWASVNGAGQLVAFTGYTNDGLGAGVHTNAVGTALAGGTTESVRFNTAGAAYTSGTLTLNDGGLLLTSNYTGGTPIAAGVGLTSAGGRDLILHNYASGAVTIAGNITGSQNVVFTGSGQTILTGTNSYVGTTFITGSSTLSMDGTARLGTGTLQMNGGTLNLTGTGTDTYAANIVLGSGDGTLQVGTGKTLVLRGIISSEANPVASLNGSNPNSGGLRITGSGTVQFGDRNDGASTVGVVNTYTGLTILGDGTNPLKVSLQGGGASSVQHTPFGSTDSWTDGTIIKNNVTLEFATQYGSPAGTDQVRYREWMQFGEQAGDQINITHLTQRQITMDGFYNFVGNVNLHVQTATLTNGGTSSGNFTFSPNEGGIFGSGDLVKTGNGTLNFYNSMTGWTGDLDLRDGTTIQYMYPGASLESTGRIYLGDPSATVTNTVTYRVQSRYGNSETAVDSGRQRFDIPRDISVRDGLKQEVRIGGSYGGEITMNYSGNIYLGSGSTGGGGATSANHVRLYYEDTTGYNGSLVGHQQHVLMNFTGNLSGSNNVLLDANEGGSANDDPNDQFVTYMFSGNNSAFTGKLTVGSEGGTGTGNYDRDDIEIFRAGSDQALSSANIVELRNLSMFQVGGNGLTIGGLISNDGVSTSGMYSFTGPTWDPNRKTTADLAAQNAAFDPTSGTLHGGTGTLNYTPVGNSSAIIENASVIPGTLSIVQNGDTAWDAYFRDGVPDARYENSADTPGSLSLEKRGTGIATLTIFNDYTGTTQVSQGALQVGQGGNGEWGVLSQGSTIVQTARADTARAVGSTGTGLTTAMAGAVISGSGHVRGSLDVYGTLAPGDAAGSVAGGGRGTLFIGNGGGGDLSLNAGAVLSMQIATATLLDVELASGNYVIGGFEYEDYISYLPLFNAGSSAFPDFFGQSGTGILFGAHDHLEIGGGVTWNGGQINVNPVTGLGAFTPEPGYVYNLMDWYGVSDWGSFDVGSGRYLVGNGDDNGDLDLPDLSAYPNLRWDTGLFTSHGVLIISTIVLVPEPSRMLFLGMGLGFILFRRRR